MSFDVHLVREACEHCGRDSGYAYSFNLTHNVNEIVDRCLTAAGEIYAKETDGAYKDRSWGRLHGYRAGHVIHRLEAALSTANNPQREAEFRSLEPENKWGDLDVVRAVLKEFLLACKENPDATIEAHG